MAMCAAIRLMLSEPPFAAQNVKRAIKILRPELTFAVDAKQRQDGLRCELEEVPGSAARARVVGGK